MNYAKEFGYNIKLLAITEKSSKGVYSSVSPALVSLDQPISKVGGNYNAVESVHGIRLLAHQLFVHLVRFRA